jgi:hypothetical protein
MLIYAASRGEGFQSASLAPGGRSVIFSSSCRAGFQSQSLQHGLRLAECADDSSGGGRRELDESRCHDDAVCQRALRFLPGTSGVVVENVRIWIARRHVPPPAETWNGLGRRSRGKNRGKNAEKPLGQGMAVPRMLAVSACLLWRYVQ